MRLLAVLACALAGCQSEPFSCSDGVQDGVETGPDCGGGSCAACPTGAGCVVAADCATGRCAGGRCAPPPACDDGARDGDESDVDCGGGCGGCPIGAACRGGADCASATCAGGRCAAAPTCSDGIANGRETDLDCGGPDCPPCPTGAVCHGDTDCVTSICAGGLCQAPPCSDGMRDGAETDVDCGGADCPQCADGAACLLDGDCLSTTCTDGACQPRADPCSPGYHQDGGKLCVCDPATCGSCCDVSEGNVCGLAQVPSGNNCGAHGQSCFRCAIQDDLNCEHGVAGDYCALACDAGPCAGCCSGPELMQRFFCRHGDEDEACGVKGADCVVCPIGTHCTMGKCQPQP